MFNSLKLPESSSIERRLSDSTLDTYSNFRNHLLSDELSDNSDDDVNTFPAKIKQKVLQIPPLDLKKPFNRLLSNAQGINRSKPLGLNKKNKMETEISNSNKGVSKKKKPNKMKPAANAVINKPVTRSASRNKENNLPAVSKRLVVPEKRSKRKLFDTEALSEQDAKKSKIEDDKSLMNQTNKSLPGLSDTAVSIFMHNFDKEMAHELSDQPVTNLVSDRTPLSTEDLPKAEHCAVFKQPNQRCYKKLPKRKSAKQSQKTVAQLLQEEVSLFATKNNYDSDDSLHDKDFEIDKCASTSNESSFTDESEDVENKKSSKTDDILVKEEMGSICSDTDSICSIASTTSRYGRVRKAPPVYINATMFGGNPRKSVEIKQKAASLINSHKCKSRSSMSIEEISRFSPEHVNFSSPIHKKADSSEFKKPANQVTPSKNGLTARRSQSRTLSSASQKSFLLENRPDKQTPNQFDFISPKNSKTVSLQLRNSANRTPLSANGSNLSNSLRSRSRSSNASKKSSFITDLADKQTDCVTPPPRLNQTTPSASGNKIAIGSNDQHALKSPTNLKIGDTFLPEEGIFKKPLDKNELTCSSQSSETSSKSKKIVIHQNVVLRPPNEQERPVKHVKPSIYNLRQNTSLARTSRSSVSQNTFQSSNDDFEDEFDDLGRRSDPNEIHAVVNDEVVSFKWHAPTPDLDSILSDENVHYSMSDLKSFYTNVKVGYLKIDAGHRKLMKVLRDCIMLYFVERGEAVFRVSEREITGQVGSTFFIPLGVEYTITSLKTEDLILKFVKMSPTASVL